MNTAVFHTLLLISILMRKEVEVEEEDGKFRGSTYGLSLPPVTISPSLRVVYMVNTGPVWALATIRIRMCSFQTHTSPLMVPVNVKLF